jgi:beta-glucosidase
MNWFQPLQLISAAIILCSTQAMSQAPNKAGLPQLNADNIREIISLMTLEEKTLFVRGANGEGILPAGFTNAIPRLGIPAMVFTDGPAGVRITPKREGDTRTYYCTAFPIETMLASSWDTLLLQQVGSAMGNETREYGMDVLLAPALNIHRNPLGGRNFEYYSEDPLISGKMAAAMVNGIQSQGVGACIKHFAVNNQETNRFNINAVVSERALREIYLQGFRIALQGSDPWTVMSSYNKINGVYTSERRDLLKTILRDEWGFRGFVMSDWRGGIDVVAQMKAWNDLLMPGKLWQSRVLDSSLRAGSLDIKTIDSNIHRILNVLVKTPTFKNYNFSNQPDLRAHAALSHKAAVESVVLLKNDAQCLPFTSNIRTVALFGKGSYNLVAGGTGSGEVNKAYTVSLQQGLRKSGLMIAEQTEAYYDSVINNFRRDKQKDKGRLREILPDLAFIEKQSLLSDIAIITIGRISGEGTDRSREDFELSEIEKELIRNVIAVYHKAGKKVVVLLNIGGVIETASWKDLPDAILLAWQPGQEAGHVIADILCGKFTPSGKLATSFPVRYEDVPSAKNFPGTPEAKPTTVVHEEGIYVGYRFHEKFKVNSSYPFGHGLSYTRFSYSGLKLSDQVFKDSLRVSIAIINSGKRAGREIVQLYLGCPAIRMDKPLKELKGFVKTRLLQPGESETVTFTISAASLASFDPALHAWVAEAGKYFVIIGTSSGNIQAKESFQLRQELVVERVHPVLMPQ